MTSDDKSYHERWQQMSIWVPRGWREGLIKIAAKAGVSRNEYLVQLIARAMDEPNPYRPDQQNDHQPDEQEARSS